MNEEIIENDGVTQIVCVLPGESEVSRCASLARHSPQLRKYGRRGDSIFTWYSGNQPERNAKARKVLDSLRNDGAVVVFMTGGLATPSVTLHFNAYIDSCQEKEVREMGDLHTVASSPVTMDQRKGRPGRLPGQRARYYQLGKPRTKEELADFILPDENALLNILRIADMGFYDLKLTRVAPERTQALQSELQALMLLDCQGKITEMGRRVLDLPFGVRPATALLVGEVVGIGRDAALAACFIESKKALFRNFTFGACQTLSAQQQQLSVCASDLHTFVEQYNKEPSRHSPETDVCSWTLQHFQTVLDRFESDRKAQAIIERFSEGNYQSTMTQRERNRLLTVAVAWGYRGNMAHSYQQWENNHGYLLSNGRQLKLSQRSVAHQTHEKWLLFCSMSLQDTMTTACPVPAVWVALFGQFHLELHRARDSLPSAKENVHTIIAQCCETYHRPQELINIIKGFQVPHETTHAPAVRAQIVRVIKDTFDSEQSFFGDSRDESDPHFQFQPARESNRVGIVRSRSSLSARIAIVQEAARRLESETKAFTACDLQKAVDTIVGKQARKSDRRRAVVREAAYQLEIAKQNDKLFSALKLQKAIDTLHHERQGLVRKDARRRAHNAYESQRTKHRPFNADQFKQRLRQASDGDVVAQGGEKRRFLWTAAAKQKRRKDTILHYKLRDARIHLTTGHWYTYRVFQASMAKDRHDKQSIVKAWNEECVKPEVRWDVRNSKPMSFYDDFYKPANAEDRTGKQLAAMWRHWEDKRLFWRDWSPKGEHRMLQVPGYVKTEYVAELSSPSGTHCTAAEALPKACLLWLSSPPLLGFLILALLLFLSLRNENMVTPNSSAVGHHSPPCTPEWSARTLPHPGSNLAAPGQRLVATPK